ncbi:MAG: hypothetical protein ABI425_02655 [Patescibacteria group bacterium]
MLVHLKQQRVLPTIFLAIFYLIFDTFCATLLIIIEIFILVVFAQSFFTYLGQDPYGIFSIFRLLAFSLTFIGIPALIFFVSRIIQKRFFKKFPLTPLFLITLAVVGSLLSTGLIAFFLLRSVAFNG